MCDRFSDSSLTQGSSKASSSAKCYDQNLPHNLPERYKNITCCWISGGYCSSIHFAPDHEYVLCTKTLELIEINKDGLPVLSCPINIQGDIITRSYIKHNELLKIFYVVRNKESKIVVIERKENALEIFAEKDDVDKFDFVAGESPCLNLWHKSTDVCSSIPLYQQNQNEISPNVIENEVERTDLMKRLDSEIAQYCSILEEKQRSLEAKRNLNHKIVSKLKEDFIYGPFAPILENGERSTPLIIKTTWKRIFNGKLIIGVEVENVSIRPIEQVYIYIDANNINTMMIDITIYTKSAPLKNNKNDIEMEIDFEPSQMLFDNIEDETDDISNWKSSDLIPPKTQTIIIAAINLPTFDCTSSYSISSVLFYSYNETQLQLSLPEIILRAVDIVTNIDAPSFEGEILDKDLLSVMSSVDYVHELTFDLQDLSFSYLSLEESMVKRILFKKISENPSCFICGDKNHALYGVLIFLIKISSKKYDAKMYTRSSKQLILLLHSIYSMLPLKTKILPKDTSLFYNEYKEKETLKNEDIEVDISNEKIKQNVCWSLLKELNKAEEFVEKCNKLEGTETLKMYEHQWLKDISDLQMETNQKFEEAQQEHQSEVSE